MAGTSRRFGWERGILLVMGSVGGCVFLAVPGISTGVRESR